MVDSVRARHFAALKAHDAWRKAQGLAMQAQGAREGHRGYGVDIWAMWIGGRFEPSVPALQLM